MNKDGHKLRLHIKSVHDKIKDLQCESCPVAFSRRTTLKKHFRTVHLGENLKPPPIERQRNFVRRPHPPMARGYPAPNLNWLNSEPPEYLPLDIPNMGMKCSRCDYVCPRPHEIRKHERAVHDQIKDKACPLCPFITAYKSQLRKHVKYTHENVTNNCDQCPYQAKSIGQVKLHIKSVHDKIKDLHCEACPAVFSRRTSLRKHFRHVHLGEKTCARSNQGQSMSSMSFYNCL